MHAVVGIEIKIVWVYINDTDYVQYDKIDWLFLLIYCYKTKMELDNSTTLYKCSTQYSFR